MYRAGLYSEVSILILALLSNILRFLAVFLSFPSLNIKYCFQVRHKSLITGNRDSYKSNNM